MVQPGHAFHRRGSAPPREVGSTADGSVPGCSAGDGSGSRVDMKAPLGSRACPGRRATAAGSVAGGTAGLRGGRRQTADGRRQTADGRRQTADGRRQIMEPPSSIEQLGRSPVGRPAGSPGRAHPRVRAACCVRPARRAGLRAVDRGGGQHAVGHLAQHVVPALWSSLDDLLRDAFCARALARDSGDGSCRRPWRRTRPFAEGPDHAWSRAAASFAGAARDDPGQKHPQQEFVRRYHADLAQIRLNCPVLSRRGCSRPMRRRAPAYRRGCGFRALLR